MKNELRVILAIKKLSIADLHENTGISKTTIYGLFYEETKHPSLTTVIKICNFLDINVDEFITGLKEV